MTRGHHRLAAAATWALHAGLAVGLSVRARTTSAAPNPCPRVRRPCDLDGFAWDWGRAQDGQLQEVDRLVGFCLLIRREVIEAIGLLDEGFGLGNFEDDDYCRRAARAGFRAVIARDAFVHHVGGQTFQAVGVDYGGLMQATRERFRQKYDPSTPAEPLPARPAGPPPSLRVLLLAHVGLFRDRMDKSHFYRYEALARRPGVTLFGPGVEGYAAGLSAEEAVRVACDGRWPDAIVHGCDPRASNVPLVSGLDRVSVVTALELTDSWAFQDRQVEFVRRLKFTIGLIQRRLITSGTTGRRAWRPVRVDPNAVNTALFRDHGLRRR